MVSMKSWRSVWIALTTVDFLTQHRGMKMSRQNMWVVLFNNKKGVDAAVYQNQPTPEEMGRTFDMDVYAEPDEEWFEVFSVDIIKNGGVKQ